MRKMVVLMPNRQRDSQEYQLLLSPVDLCIPQAGGRSARGMVGRMESQ